jgi:hypothetical protein
MNERDMELLEIDRDEARHALHDARHEVERLRAALTRIMELGYHSLDPDVDKRMTILAREALK